MQSRLSSLETCLDFNKELKSVIFKVYEDNEEYLRYLDTLFCVLSQPSVTGLDIKIKETMPKKGPVDTNPLFHFQSLMSELEFARFFVNSKMSVDLLSANAFYGRKSPDMLVKNTIDSYYVEVKNIRLDDEAWDFGLRVADVLNKKGLKYMVIVTSTNRLSIPAYMHKSIEEKDKTTQFALSEFQKKVGCVQSDLSKAVITTDIATIELRQTLKDKSFLGINTMEEAITEPAEYYDRIKYDIKVKCEKRNHWVNRELEIPYLIAIDDESWLFSIDNYNALLYGDATTGARYQKGNLVYYLPCNESEITDKQTTDAIEKGWKEYLIKMCILPNAHTVIPKEKRGLFFTEAVTKNATAVLIRKHNNTCYLLANPFAEDRINRSTVLESFRGCQTGWE